jgi:hypothetical protein
MDIDVLHFEIDILIDFSGAGPASAGQQNAIAGCSSVLGTDCSECVFTPRGGRTAPRGQHSASTNGGLGGGGMVSGRGALPLRRVGGGLSEEQPHSPWFYTGHCVSIHLQNSTLEGHCVSSGTDKNFMRQKHRLGQKRFNF